jgi:hypothetical protein
MDHPAMAIILPSLTIWIFTKRSVLRWCGGLGWGAGLIVGIPIFAFYLIGSAMCAGVLLSIRWFIAKSKATEDTP